MLVIPVLCLTWLLVQDWFLRMNSRTFSSNETWLKIQIVINNRMDRDQNQNQILFVGPCLFRAAICVHFRVAPLAHKNKETLFSTLFFALVLWGLWWVWKIKLRNNKNEKVQKKYESLFNFSWKCSDFEKNKFWVAKKIYFNFSNVSEKLFFCFFRFQKGFPLVFRFWLSWILNSVPP